MATRRTLTDSPFDTLEKTFRLLVTGPRPLALEGEAVVGLLPRLIPLDELKAILLHPSTSYQVRDETLAELVNRARDSESWMVGLAAVVLPGVRSVVWSLVQACPDKAEDIEAETLAGLVAAIRDIDVSRPRIAVRLVWRSRKAAKRLVRLEMAEQGRPAPSPVPGAPPQPWGHPDLVLIEAVERGVVAADSAELIGSTRLGSVGLDEAAAALHVGYWAAHKRRSRAETAVVGWLASEGHRSQHFVQKGAAVPHSPGAGRPRQGL